MYLAIALIAYLLSAVWLYRGFSNPNLLDLMVAAVWMAVGKVNIRRYKENKN